MAGDGGRWSVRKLDAEAVGKEAAVFNCLSGIIVGREKCFREISKRRGYTFFAGITGSIEVAVQVARDVTARGVIADAIQIPIVIPLAECGWGTGVLQELGASLLTRQADLVEHGYYAPADSRVELIQPRGPGDGEQFLLPGLR